MENEYLPLAILLVTYGWIHGGKVIRETREGKRAGVTESDSILDFFFRGEK